MENMLHLRYHAAALLDQHYVFSPDQLPTATAADHVSLPLIDMSGSRDEVRRAILDAGKEFGFFIVVNHGVPEQVMQDMEEVCEEFFRRPAEDKAHLYSEDRHKPNRIFTGATYDTGGEKYWRDCLRLALPYPVRDGSTKDWPDKPLGIREKIEKFTLLTRVLALELLRLLSEGLGLRPDYFEGDISGGDVVLNINHYPPCPDPTTTLGLPPHCDRNLITLLLPGKVHGLDVAHGGEWLRVEPPPAVRSACFVVNFGQQLEVVTNGLLRSVEHRVVTNAEAARTAVATFVMPTPDCVIGPAEEFVGEDNPPGYRTLRFDEFMRVYNVVKLGSAVNLTTNLKAVQKDV